MSTSKNNFDFTTPSGFLSWVADVRDDFLNNGIAKIKNREITAKQLEKKLKTTRDQLNAGIAYAKSLGFAKDFLPLE
jgi:hypothetical protein